MIKLYKNNAYKWFKFNNIYTIGYAFHNNYLYNAEWWWSMSPSYFSIDGHSYIFRVGTTGSLDGGYINYTRGVRPAISLKNGIQVSGGDGTIASPYTVE